jgi:hypothetical protein
MNNHPVEPVPDLQGGWVELCDNSPKGYEDAIRKLLGDENLRRTWVMKLANSPLRISIRKKLFENFNPVSVPDAAVVWLACILHP